MFNMYNYINHTNIKTINILEHSVQSIGGWGEGPRFLPITIEPLISIIIYSFINTIINLQNKGLKLLKTLIQ